ncbi:hypothetical protein N7504_005672 [Penicillium tannophilum]|nr:hypothetical protein N7504_005672 [Penicillium tannophilum]
MSNARALFAFTRVSSAKQVKWIDSDPSRYPFHHTPEGEEEPESDSNLTDQPWSSSTMSLVAGPCQEAKNRQDWKHP